MATAGQCADPVCDLLNGELISNKIDDSPAVEHLGCLELLSDDIPTAVSNILDIKLGKIFRCKDWIKTAGTHHAPPCARKDTWDVEPSSVHLQGLSINLHT